MTIHVQLWSAVPSSWLSFQCCYVKGWSWLVGSCHMTCCALVAFWKVEMFLSRCGADAPGKNERVAPRPRRFHYERAYRASTFEITNLSAQKTQYVKAVCARRHSEMLCHSAWVPRWDVLGLKLLCLNWQDLKHVRIKNFLEEAALAWSLR